MVNNGKSIIILHKLSVIFPPFEGMSILMCVCVCVCVCVYVCVYAYVKYALQNAVEKVPLVSHLH